MVGRDAERVRELSKRGVTVAFTPMGGGQHGSRIDVAGVDRDGIQVVLARVREGAAHMEVDVAEDAMSFRVAGIEADGLRAA